MGEEFSQTIYSEEKSLTKKVRTNPWIISTIVLGVFVLILLITNFSGGLTGKIVSEQDAGNIALNFINTNLVPNGNLTFDSVKEDSSIGCYVIQIPSNGQTIPVYLSKDGQYIDFGMGMVNIATYSKYIDPQRTATTSQSNTQPTDVPKSDKPVVEAFIFSYCPYGLQFEKALIPVYNLLKNKADINIMAIGAMHGEFEQIESFRQVCIEKIYGKDKLFSYLKAFDESSDIGKCAGDADCLKPLIQKIFTTLGIDESDVNNCMDNDARALYASQGARASELGISGSPTLVINDVKVQVTRTPDAIKEIICSAFTTAPTECSQNISSSSASAGFGADASSSSSSSSCG